MAKLWIREYARAGSASSAVSAPRGGIPVAMEPGSDQPVVDFTGGVQQSPAFANSTSFIEIISDTDCHYLIGGNPTATTGAMKLIAGTSKFFGVEPGAKLSVIAAS